MKKLILFDCDETLWTSVNQDFISSCKSELILIKKDVLVRSADGSKFCLKPNLRQALAYLKLNNYSLGIVSDNSPGPVNNALKLFGIDNFFESKLSNIYLWKGYCQKQIMVLEIIKNSKIKIKPEQVLWIDDKDYAGEAKAIGVGFMKASDDLDYYNLVKNKL